jgi:hypothetical protein
MKSCIRYLYCSQEVLKLRVGVRVAVGKVADVPFFVKLDVERQRITVSAVVSIVVIVPAGIRTEEYE